MSFFPSKIFKREKELDTGVGQHQAGPRCKPHVKPIIIPFYRRALCSLYLQMMINSKYTTDFHSTASLELTGKEDGRLNEND